MAETISNLDQVSQLLGAVFTSSTVADADGSIPVITAVGSRLDENPSTNGCLLANTGTSFVANEVYTAIFTLPSPVDVSGDKQALVIHYKNNTIFAAGQMQDGAGACRLYLFSGTGTSNWARYDANGFGGLDWVPLIAGVSTPEATGGTFDDTDVTKIAIGWKARNNGSFTCEFSLSQLLHVNGILDFGDTNTDATDLVDFVNLLAPLSGETYHSQLVKQAGPTYEFGVPFDITARNFSDSVRGIAFLDDGKSFISSNVDASYWELALTPPSSGTISFTNLTVATNSNIFDFTVDASAGTCNLTSTLIVTTDVVSLTGANLNIVGSTIADPNACTIADGDLDLIISASVAAIQWTGDLVSGSSITTDSDVDVTFDVGNYADIGWTFTANNNVTVSPTTDASTYDFGGFLNAGFTTDFDIPSGNTFDTTIATVAAFTATRTNPTTGGGEITLSSPVSTFTINVSESGALIQVFTTTTQTVLASATSNTLAYIHSGETVDYVIQKAGFIPQRVTALVLSGDQTVPVELVTDPVYNASHGLVYTTDASWSRSLNQLTVPTYSPTVRGVWSLMIDSFIAETTLRNTQFNLTMNGPNSMFLIEDAEGVNDATIENMTDGGVRYINTSDTATAEWAGLQSTGIATGFTGEFQQVDGSGTTDARATGQFDELIKSFGDASHGNFDFRGHLVLKYQPNGYREVRIDVLDVYGISVLEPVLYVIGMEPIAISAATGDPAISITIVDHTGAPLVVGGKSFDFEIQGGGADSGTSILREINYNLSLDATYQGRDPFNWPEMVRELGDDYDTAQGLVEGISGNHGFYVSRSGSDHPDFTRFQSNDGTYYTPAVTANISISALSDDGGSTRLQIHNETAKTASAWASLTAYSAGTKALRSTGLGSESTGGLYFVATTAGTSGASEPTWDTTVGNTTSDGSVTWTTFAILYYDADPTSTSYSDSYIDGEEFVSGDTFRIRFADLNGSTSFKTYETTGVVAVSGFTVEASPVADAVYAINAIDGSSTAITDIYTADYANNEIDLDANLDFTNLKSFAFISFEQTTSQGMFQIWASVTAIDAANYRNDVSVISIAFDETAGFVKQEDSDTSRWYKSDGTRPFKDPTTGGNGISMNWKNPVYTISTGSVLTASEKAQITNIETKTNPLSYTVPNQLDANIQSVNDVAVSGTGAEGDEWGS